MKKITKVTAILYFRWLFIVIIILYSVTTLKNEGVSFILVGTITAAIIYNFLITLKYSRVKDKSQKTSVLIACSDIVLLSVFSFQLGGMDSDIYILFYFILWYYGMHNHSTHVIRFGIFCVAVYSISSIYAAKVNMADIDLLRLFIRDLFVIIAAFGIYHIKGEVKKHDEMHKKEFRLARTDKLTGLANRHYFDQKLGEEVNYADYTGNPLNILIFDIDNFKKFNDTYGHVQGDEMLTLFSNIIKENIRKSDTPVRYGGEEFLVLIRDMDIYIAKSVGERIRRQLENQRIYMGDHGERKKVTVSCGIAQYPRHSSNIKKVIEYADKALYHAKKTGKNTVVVFDEIEHI